MIPSMPSWVVVANWKSDTTHEGDFSWSLFAVAAVVAVSVAVSVVVVVVAVVFVGAAPDAEYDHDVVGYAPAVMVHE
jgi:hypothetical protein